MIFKENHKYMQSSLPHVFVALVETGGHSLLENNASHGKSANGKRHSAVILLIKHM